MQETDLKEKQRLTQRIIEAGRGGPVKGSSATSCSEHRQGDLVALGFQYIFQFFKICKNG